MSVLLMEQETVINMSRLSEYAEIYTSDRTMMTKYDKLAESEDAPDWVCTGIQYDQDGELVAKTYRTKKKLISNRSSAPKREYSEEQLENLRENGRKALEKARLKRKEEKEAAD